MGWLIVLLLLPPPDHLLPNVPPVGGGGASMSCGGAQMQWHEDFLTLKWTWHRRRCFYNTVRVQMTEAQCYVMNGSLSQTSQHPIIENDRMPLMRWWNTACAGRSNHMNLSVDPTGAFQFVSVIIHWWVILPSKSFYFKSIPVSASVCKKLILLYIIVIIVKKKTDKL